MVLYCDRRTYYELIEKGYGKRDYSKLQKVPVVDKNGETRMVYKKVGTEENKKTIASNNSEKKITTNSLSAAISKNLGLKKMQKTSSYSRDSGNGKIAYKTIKNEKYTDGDFYITSYGNQFTVFLDSDIAKKKTNEMVNYLKKIGGKLSPRTIDELDSWEHGNNKMPFFNYSIVVDFNNK